MKINRKSAFAIAIALFIFISACHYTDSEVGNPETAKPEAETAYVSFNEELISLIGKPFEYFNEKYGWDISDLDTSIGGPYAGTYKCNDATYTFNSLRGSFGLTGDTPCMSIDLPYTMLLPGGEDLTTEKLTEIFGVYTDRYLSYGCLDVYYDNVTLRFFVTMEEDSADYTFDPYIYITYNWQPDDFSGVSTLTPDEIGIFLRTFDFSEEAWIRAKRTLNPTLLYKAAGSLYYHDGYFSMAYDGLDGYASSDLKRKLITRIMEGWDYDFDPVAEKLKKAVRSNKYFSEAFAEKLIKTSYTYSYHALAEEYGIKPNRTYADAKDVRFTPHEDGDFGWYYTGMAEAYLTYDECRYYELDFDGDGVDELGIPVHSGAGGAFMADGFAVFKKNSDGLYQFYGSGPDCTMRDAMRLIQYDGRIYFITNPFSDDMSALHDIHAFTLDETGARCELFLTCTDYELGRVASTDDGSTPAVESHVKAAVAATKRHELYSPQSENIISSEGGEHYGDGIPYTDPQDIFFAADIDNDGEMNIIHKGHKIIQTKYYDDYNLFQIYKNHEDFTDNAVSIRDHELYEEYYGLHSDGNIYDLIPVKGKIVQLFAGEISGSTYIFALTRQQLLYTLHVWLVRGGEAQLIGQTLYFDEVQDIKVNLLEDE